MKSVTAAYFNFDGNCRHAMSFYREWLLNRDLQK